MAGDPRAAHLLRRIGFGFSDADLSYYSGIDPFAAVNFLVDYEQIPDTVDTFIGHPAFATVRPSRGTDQPFSPNTNINDARQRWLFRMVHSQRWLEEKMTLFWHNHFATGYSKISGIIGDVEATRVMAAKPSEDPGGVRGQIELFRQYATGNFRLLLQEVAKDVAMLYWLDGRDNVKARPQENFARELMELFTVGVQFYTEPDVYAAARVFTGWNLRLAGRFDDPARHYEFIFRQTQHDYSAKTFSFPIYANGDRTIPLVVPQNGITEGYVLIDALARHPETARRLARKLYGFFVSDVGAPDEALVEELATVYLVNDCEMKPVLRYLFMHPIFWSSPLARYSWPVEFAVRLIKQNGWVGFNLQTALGPLSRMSQILFDPPDVSGWDTGPSWFSPGAMLERMNFANAVARSQRTSLVDSITAVPGGAASPERVVDLIVDRFAPTVAPDVRQELYDYARAGAAWSGSVSQLTTKVPALVHLVCGSPEYQFV